MRKKLSTQSQQEQLKFLITLCSVARIGHRAKKNVLNAAIDRFWLHTCNKGCLVRLIKRDWHLK